MSKALACRKMASFIAIGTFKVIIAAQTHLSFHLLSVDIMGGTPGGRGETGQQGESQVNNIILFKIFVNILLVSVSFILKRHLYFHTWHIWKMFCNLSFTKDDCLALEHFVHLVKDFFALDLDRPQNYGLGFALKQTMTSLLYSPDIKAMIPTY